MDDMISHSKSSTAHLGEEKPTYGAATPQKKAGARNQLLRVTVEYQKNNMFTIRLFEALIESSPDVYIGVSVGK